MREAASRAVDALGRGQRDRPDQVNASNRNALEPNGVVHGAVDPEVEVWIGDARDDMREWIIEQGNVETTNENRPGLNDVVRSIPNGGVDAAREARSCDGTSISIGCNEQVIRAETQHSATADGRAGVDVECNGGAQVVVMVRSVIVVFDDQNGVGGYGDVRPHMRHGGDRLDDLNGIEIVAADGDTAAGHDSVGEEYWSAKNVVLQEERTTVDLNIVQRTTLSEAGIDDLEAGPRRCDNVVQEKASGGHDVNKDRDVDNNDIADVDRTDHGNTAHVDRGGTAKAIDGHGVPEGDVAEVGQERCDVDGHVIFKHKIEVAGALGLQDVGGTLIINTVAGLGEITEVNRSAADCSGDRYVSGAGVGSSITEGRLLAGPTGGFALSRNGRLAVHTSGTVARAKVSRVADRHASAALSG